MVDIDLLAAAVTATPGVADLHGGPQGAVATYLPGRRIRGIRAVDDVVEVHVVAWPDRLVDVADRVRDAAAPHVGGRRVDVTIGDLATDAAPAPAPAPLPSTAPPPDTTMEHTP